jgi:hypothetical protein
MVLWLAFVLCAVFFFLGICIGVGVMSLARASRDPVAYVDSARRR